MLLGRRLGRRLAPPIRTLSSRPAKLEFTLGLDQPIDVSAEAALLGDVGMAASGIQSQFASLALRHEAAFATVGPDAFAQLYADKAVFEGALVRDLFDDLDRSRSGSLDRDELLAGLARIGLPATPAQADRVLARADASGDGELRADEFAKLVEETWGRGVAVERDADDDARAVARLGSSAPAHFVLRALRHLWPFDVDEVAILRNDDDNPALDPRKMRVHDETFVPSVSEATDNVGKLSLALLDHEPRARGGFVVRLTSGGETVYVPLRGASAPGVARAHVAEVAASGMGTAKFPLHFALVAAGFGVGAYGFALIVFPGLA